MAFRRSVRPSRRRRPEPVLITTAARSPEEERRHRERRYLLTMGLRVVLFVLAVVLFHGVWAFLAAGVSLVLPWVAVVMANAGPDRHGPEHPSLYGPPRRALHGPDDRAP